VTGVQENWSSRDKKLSREKTSQRKRVKVAPFVKSVAEGLNKGAGKKEGITGGHIRVVPGAGEGRGRGPSPQMDTLLVGRGRYLKNGGAFKTTSAERRP